MVYSLLLFVLIKQLAKKSIITSCGQHLTVTKGGEGGPRRRVTKHRPSSVLRRFGPRSNIMACFPSRALQILKELINIIRRSCPIVKRLAGRNVSSIFFSSHLKQFKQLLFILASRSYISLGSAQFSSDAISTLKPIRYKEATRPCLACFGEECVAASSPPNRNFSSAVIPIFGDGGGWP